MSITTTITPFLTVSSARKAFEFYIKAFGAVVSEQEALSNGGLTGRVTIDSAAFWVGDEEPEFGNIAPDAARGAGVRMILIVDRPEDIFSGALAAGAREICPVVMEESWKIGKLVDPFGHVWEIGHPL